MSLDSGRLLQLKSYQKYWGKATGFSWILEFLPKFAIIFEYFFSKSIISVVFL